MFADHRNTCYVCIVNKHNDTDMYIASDYAKSLGIALPRGKKKLIAQQLGFTHYYVRYILTGNGGRNLTTEKQIAIVSKAIDIINGDIDIEIARLTNKKCQLPCL